MFFSRGTNSTIISYFKSITRHMIFIMRETQSIPAQTTVMLCSCCRIMTTILLLILFAMPVSWVFTMWMSSSLGQNQGIINWGTLNFCGSSDWGPEKPCRLGTVLSRQRKVCTNAQSRCIWFYWSCGCALMLPHTSIRRWETTSWWHCDLPEYSQCWWLEVLLHQLVCVHAKSSWLPQVQTVRSCT